MFTFTYARMLAVLSLKRSFCTRNRGGGFGVLPCQMRPLSLVAVLFGKPVLKSPPMHLNGGEMRPLSLVAFSFWSSLFLNSPPMHLNGGAQMILRTNGMVKHAEETGTFGRLNRSTQMILRTNGMVEHAEETGVLYCRPADVCATRPAAGNWVLAGPTWCVACVLCAAIV